MPVIRNKRTGETIFVPDAGPQMPANPEYPYKGPQAAAGVAQTRASTARTQQDMRQDAALFPAQKQTADLQAQVAALKLAQERAAAEQAQREADAKNPFNTQGLQDISQSAMQQLQAIDRIKETDRSSVLPTIGFGAETMAGIGGTGAADIAANTDSLQSASALQKVMQMAQQNGGKNPLTPMSNTDVAMLAKGIGNLSQTQSRGNFMANLNNYAAPLKRAYAGAQGMQTLDAELRRLGIEKMPPAQQQRVRADALRRYQQNMAARSAPRKVDRNNDGIPDDVRSILGKYGVR